MIVGRTHYNYFPGDAILNFSKVWVTGGSGLVGHAVLELLKSKGIAFVAPSSQALNLLDGRAVTSFVKSEAPDALIMAGARVGGVKANMDNPASFILDNLRMQDNVFKAALESGITRLVYLSSSCVFPVSAELPFSESSIFSGPLHDSVKPYAIAKLSGMEVVRTVNLEHGFNWISAIPCNVYGPWDNFSLSNGHVLASLVRKFWTANQTGADTVEVWGSGRATREFLHVEDLANAIFLLLSIFESGEPINLSSGEEVTVHALAEIVQQISGFRGSLVFNPEMPEGALRKVQDNSQIRSLGWYPSKSLYEGIRGTYSWFDERMTKGMPIRL